MKNKFSIAVHAALKAGKAIMEVYGEADFQVEYKADNSPLTLADRRANEIITRALKKTGLPVLSEEGREIPYMNRSWWSSFWLVDPLDGTKEFISRNGEFTVNIALVVDGKASFGVVYAPALKRLYVGHQVRGAFVCSDEKNFRQPFDYLAQFATPLPTTGPTTRPATAPATGPTTGSATRPATGPTTGPATRPATGPTTGPDAELYRVVASRSHFNQETRDYVDALDTAGKKVSLVNAGSSLKLCMVAAGEADIYPRLGPTMEWDTAAAHAVVKAAGRNVYRIDNGLELEYNKENLLNPYFVVR